MNMHAIAMPLTVADIIDEYASKAANVDANVAEFKAAHDRLSMMTTVSGVYMENVTPSDYVDARAIRRNLLRSGWKAVYRRLSIEALASANDKRLFEQTLAAPPDLTLENAKATFGDYLLRPRFHQLRALAECFTSLDPAYKSHSKVKIGVAGLPKRIILSGFRGYGSWGKDRFKDVLNALAGVSGLPLVEQDELKELDELTGAFANRAGRASLRGVEVRVFENGNAHVHFEPETLFTINRALAEFYGEVLPDADADDAPPRPSTDLCADLQFYPTPRRVIDMVLDKIGLTPMRERRVEERQASVVLEPSCGDGRILDAIRERGHKSLGVEVHPGRAAEARRKGHSVLTGNFLEAATAPTFDYVVMNPPFFGTHWKKHIAHALKCLKPGGTLACILPASAKYDHGVGGTWHDLPVASFSESGTNIPTGFTVIRKDDL